MFRICAGALVVATVITSGGNGYTPVYPTHQQKTIVLRNGLRTDALGCYELIDSVGKGGLEGVPPVIRLDSAIDPTDHSQPPPTTHRTLQSVPPDTRPRDPITREMHPRWAADSLTDTLRLAFTNGFVGAIVAINLPSKSSSDTLSGLAFPFSDLPAVGKPRRNIVLGIRRTCPGAHSSAAQHDR